MKWGPGQDFLNHRGLALGVRRSPDPGGRGNGSILLRREGRPGCSSPERVDEYQSGASPGRRGGMPDLAGGLLLIIDEAQRFVAG